jgi:hypothetical protein
VQSDRAKLPHKGDREKNILMSLAFFKELDRIFEFEKNIFKRMAQSARFERATS